MTRGDLNARLDQELDELLFQYPLKDDWNQLISTIPYERLQVSVADFKRETRSLEDFVASSEIYAFAIHLSNRLSDVCKSYVMMMYYFNMGIPDDEWFRPEGPVIRYFPHFQKRHHFIKRQFDYYADVFYYKVFSAWDNIGHLLNLAYDLRMKSKHVSFKRAIPKLESKNGSLYRNLKSILEDDAFAKASELRNAVTHNYLPSQVGSGIVREEDVVVFGVGSYIASREIGDNVVETVNLLAKTLDYIKASTGSPSRTSSIA